MISICAGCTDNLFCLQFNRFQKFYKEAKFLQIWPLCLNIYLTLKSFELIFCSWERPISSNRHTDKRQDCGQDFLGCPEDDRVHLLFTEIVYFHKLSNKTSPEVLNPLKWFNDLLQKCYQIIFGLWLLWNVSNWLAPENYNQVVTGIF